MFRRTTRKQTVTWGGGEGEEGLFNGGGGGDTSARLIQPAAVWSTRYTHHVSTTCTKRRKRKTRSVVVRLDFDTSLIRTLYIYIFFFINNHC